MADGNFFNGNFTRRPSARAAVDLSGLGRFQVGNPNTIVLIGQSAGGKPGTLLPFSRPNDAAAVLRDGDLVRAAFRAFNPSIDGSGPSTIIFIRVNPSTQAKGFLDNVSVAHVIGLLAQNWGVLDNNINVAVAAGTITGKKVTINYRTQSYVLDNLARNSFTLKYNGAGSAAVATINGTTLTTTCTGAAGDNLNLTLANFDTIQSLVAYLNAAAGGVYSAVVSTTNPNDPVMTKDSAGSPITTLDFITAVDIKTAPLQLTSNLQAIINAINSGSQQLVTANRQPAAGTVPANVSAVFLTGGTDNGDGSSTHLDGTANGGSALSNADWAFCLGLCDTQDIASITTLTADATVHALLKTEVLTISAAGVTPRVGFAGAAAGEYTSTLTNYLTRAQNLNTRRVGLIAQGINDNDDRTGALAFFEPWIVAAQMAGLAASVPNIGDSFTYKTLRGLSLEWTPTIANIETLIQGGIIPQEFVVANSIIRVSRAITTWLQDDNLGNTEFSVVESIDQLIRDVLAALNVLIGRKGGPALLALMASTTHSVLLAEQEVGVIVGDADSPAFQNISATINGDVGTVKFQASPGVPMNFVDITAHLNLFTGKVQVVTSP